MWVSSVLLIFSLIFTAGEVTGSAAFFDINTKPQLNQKAISQSQFPSTCEQALEANNQTSGIFVIEVPNYPDPFYVNCIQDPARGHAWTLIQRRQCGTINFNRGWDDYSTGFGNLNSEFFIGLKKINALTASGRHELWVQLEHFDLSSRYALYDNFTVGNYGTNYTLQSIGNYNGTAGDSLSYHVGSPFSTKDKNTNYGCSLKNCAKMYKGGWWFNCCFSSHLNGQYYGNEVDVPNTNGIHWGTFMGSWYSLKYAHMAIRPV